MLPYQLMIPMSDGGRLGYRVPMYIGMKDMIIKFIDWIRAFVKKTDMRMILFFLASLESSCSLSLKDISACMVET